MVLTYSVHGRKTIIKVLKTINFTQWKKNNNQSLKTYHNSGKMKKFHQTRKHRNFQLIADMDTNHAPPSTTSLDE